MQPQFWIGVQVFLDIAMVVLLVFFLRSFSRREATWREHEAIINKAETVLVEMREISRSLEANLQEKKELSKRMLAQMDQELKRAEESYRRISAILPELSRVNSDRSQRMDPERTRSSVFALLEKGLNKEDIARILGVSLGEIELMTKLWNPKERG